MNCSVQKEDDLDMLLRLNNERFQDTPWDITGRRDSVNAFVKGWPQIKKLKAACEKSIAMQFQEMMASWIRILLRECICRRSQVIQMS